MKQPFSIVIDTQDNRWVGPAYKPLKLPKGHSEATINPMVMCEVEDVKEAIEAFKQGNRTKVNQILSKYF